MGVITDEQIKKDTTIPKPAVQDDILAAELDVGLRNLNASALASISKTIDADPAGDIEVVLLKVYRSYPKLRQARITRLTKKREGAYPLLFHPVQS
jgi:hypothetical protein